MTNPLNAIGDIHAMFEINQPAIMLGEPGTGKSDIAREASRQYLADVTGDPDVKLIDTATAGGFAGRNFIDLRPANLEPVDIHGFPSIDKDAGLARWVPTGLLPNENDAPVGVLYIDEITNAPKSMQGSLYGLVLDRFVGEYKMPEGWRIVAAGNRVEDRAAAGKLASALANRFTFIDLEPTVDDWIKWAIANGMPAELISFIRFRPELLNDFDGNRDRNATSRSIAVCGKIINAKLPKDREARLINGSIGDGPGAELCAFLEVWRELPNPDAVLMDPEGARVPDNSAGRYAISGAIAKRVKESSLEAMTVYLGRLPSEFGVMAMRDATTRDPELTNTHAFIAWAQDNQDYYL